MKNAMKVFCFVLAVILAGTVTCLIYFKWDKGEFTYVDGEKSGTVVITGYIGEDKDVVIPNKLRGKKVTAIEESAFMEAGITSIQFNDYITSIAQSAFNGCTSLESITIGKSVLSIGDYAFGNCSALKKVMLNESLEKIGLSVFTNDTALEEVELNGNKNFLVEDGILYSADKTILYEVLPYANLTEYEVSSTVTAIREYAFAKCTTLQKITLSDSIKTIPSFCFMGCTSLKELVIPDGVSKIQTGFIAASGVERVVVPKSVTTIEKAAFNGIEHSVTIATPALSNAEYFAKENNMKVETIQ